MASRSTASDRDATPVLPHNVLAERSVLGAILLDNGQLATVAGILRAEDFFLAQHQKILNAMIELAGSHQPIDLIVLSECLERRGELEAAGSAAYLSQLMDGLPRVTAVEHYARIIKDDACRRLAIHRSQAITQAAFAREDIAEINARFQDTADLIRPAQERVPSMSAKDFCALTLRPCPYLVDGLIKSPSMMELFSWRGIGKTMFALGLSNAIASGSAFLKWKACKSTPVFYIDGELDGDELQRRLSFLCAADNENLTVLCCDMLEDPFPHLATARAQRIIEDRLGDARLLVLDNLSALAPSSNEEEGAHWILIQAWLKSLKRQGVSSLFLHHAGHSGSSRGTTRREDLLDLVIELKHPSDHKASEGLRVEINFGKTRRHLGRLAEPLEASLTTDLDGNGLWTYRDLEDARVAQIIELKAAGHSFRKIEELSGVPRSTAERLWRNAQGGQKE